MRAVLNETLRLFPPVPLNVRESRPAAVALPPSHPPSYYASKIRNSHSSPGPISEKSDLSSYPQQQSQFIPTPTTPLFMPGSTPIMYMPMLMQRNPDLWGADADEFDPERFLDPERTSKLTANPMMFQPFSSGPRIVRHFLISSSSVLGTERIFSL